MKPTLGRILHYYDADRNKVLAGIVTNVNEDESFDITVFYVNGDTSARFSLTDKHQASDPANAQPEQWFWPPRI